MDNVGTIIQLGYSRDQAERALRNSGGDLENAIESLLSGNVVFDDPVHYPLQQNNHVHTIGEDKGNVKDIKSEMQVVRDDIQRYTNIGLTQSLKQRVQPYILQHQEVKDKINLMIMNYLDTDPDFIDQLIYISERMDDTVRIYNQLAEQGLVDTSAAVNHNNLNSSGEKINNNLDGEEPVQPIKRHKSLFIVPDRVKNSKNVEAFTCSICFDDIEIGEGYVVEQCKHAFCKDCFKDYLNEKIATGMVLDIPCMDQTCDKKLDYYDVRNLVEAQHFQKYEEFCFVAALKEDPNAMYCQNPKGCTNVFINNQPKFEKKFTCTECRYEWCGGCMESWHTGTCEEFQQWKIENSKDEKNFELWKKANTKPCPSCKARTQKNDGCNHMTCGNCRYQWCWLCDGKYSSNHFSSLNLLGCPGQQFSGAGSNNDPTVAAKQHRKAVGKKVGIGVGIAVGVPILVPVGIGLVGVGLVIAAPIALVGGVTYGAYKLTK